MIDFFDWLYGSIRGNNIFLNRIRFYSAQRLIIRLGANYFLPVYFFLTSKVKKYSLKTGACREPRVIVTLTSFPKRINNLWLVIECILRQTIRPSEIVLWLSKEQFNSIESLPKRLLKQREKGLKIVLVEQDLRSHKKYFYAIQQFSNDILITLDDDIFYPSNAIKELLMWHQVYPNTIIARYGVKIKVINNEIGAYKTWEEQFDNKAPSFNFFFGSGGGTLFPPYSLPKETINKKVFMEICPMADDVWLNAMCRLNNKKVFITHNELRSILPVIHKGNVSLATINYYQNFNDVQLKNVRKYFLKHYSIDPFATSLFETETK